MRDIDSYTSDRAGAALTLYWHVVTQNIRDTQPIRSIAFFNARARRLRWPARIRSLALPHLPDSLKLRLEMYLYDSPLYLVMRNGERLVELVIQRAHNLPSLPIQEVEA